MYRSLITIEPGGAVVLPEPELHHLVRVRRARPGTEFIGLDGSGGVYQCLLTRDRGEWAALIVGQIESKAESPLEVTLAQSLIKKDRFEWVVQKCTELGVVRFVPLLTARTELRLEARQFRRFVDRWGKIVLESVKQCGRARVPAIGEPVSLDEYLENDRAAVRICLDEDSPVPFGEFIAGRQDLTSCTVLVGPEGGWDDRDRRILDLHQVVSFRLGPRILRTETAPVAIVSILQYNFGDLGA